ncbi:MAG: beta-lactamase family protein [Deltaproteobacteria bacterium]|nr:beta-lactamase family protein [Deltaproteobacteria bacterium]
MRAGIAGRAAPIVEAAVGTLFTACVLLVERKGDRSIHAAGTLCPDAAAGPDAPCSAASLFDLGGLTALATAALALACVRDRTVTLETPLRELVPDFRGGWKDDVTVGHVLTHTAGIAPDLRLRKDASSPDEAVWRAASEPLAESPGTLRPSELGPLLLGAGLERVLGMSLRDAVRERVAAQVEAPTLDFGPRPGPETAATAHDTEWRLRRLRGEVLDENAALLGGVAGHAGLFGSATDLAALARVFAEGAVIGDALAARARTEHARDGNVRRGLGVALRAPHAPMCGRSFSIDAWGLGAPAGASLWVDPASDTRVVLLTNRAYHPVTSDEAFWRFRVAVHDAVGEGEREEGT